MNPNISLTIELPFCQLACWINNNQLTLVRFLPSPIKPIPATTPIAKHIQQEFLAYIKNPLHHFNLDLLSQGTAFQQKVWKALTKIPRGQTVTYGALAKQLNSIPRAIGNACRENPYPIIVPCHRVKAKNSIGGFCGEETGILIQVKHQLIEHELQNLA